MLYRRIGCALLCPIYESYRKGVVMRLALGNPRPDLNFSARRTLRKPCLREILQHSQERVPIALALGQPNAALDVGQMMIHQLLRF